MDLYVKAYKDLSRDDLYDIARVRMQTFVVEQGINYVDLDARDKESIHVWLADQEGIQAYLRVFKLDDQQTSMGRVLTRKRGMGLGRRIVQAGIDVIKENYTVSAIRIHAQSYIQSLYAKEGFSVSSEEFLEEGIPHVEMHLSL